MKILNHLIYSISFILCGNYCVAQKIVKVYPKTQLGLSYFKRTTTLGGKVIDYKFLKNSRIYFLQWGNAQSLRTHPDTLTLDDAPVRNPVYVAEGKDFILMSYGCGSECFVGLFLPMNLNKSPIEIHEYQAYDLRQNLVAYFDHKSKTPQIIVENLKTRKRQIIQVASTCASASPAFCGSINIKNKSLIYNWSQSAGEKAADNTTRKISITI